MNYPDDPTALFRQGTRLAEGRYQAEILFRNRMSDEHTDNPEKIESYARTAIMQAAIFEQQWLIDTMQEQDTRPDPVADDELRIYEVEPTK